MAVVEIRKGAQRSDGTFEVDANPRQQLAQQNEVVEFQLKNGVEPALPGDTLLVRFDDPEAFFGGDPVPLDQPQFAGPGDKPVQVTARKKGTYDYVVVAHIGGQLCTDLNCPSIHVQ